MSQRAGAKLLFAAFLLIQAGGEPTVRECLAAGAIGETSTAPLTLRFCSPGYSDSSRNGLGGV